MLLKELVEKKRVSFHEKFDNWEDAVQASCEPLIEDGSITQEYVDAVIGCVKKYGPYIVFTPHIAMPHSQEKAVGVNNTAISFMKVKQTVEFEPGNPDKNAEVFFALASSDHDEHLKNMEQLALMLLKPGIVDELTAVENEEDLVRLDELLEDI
ncbi:MULTISPECIES: PTS sugar transporter subunit IIA [Clostridium]|uniref:PTS sugar transporter subunit IIA n=1 Tax=Clostridium TaxID=1485 RepID=UPI0018A6BE5F|nr:MULTISPECIES: PTS sugar transporter subunit IIA [Clostridium]MCI6139674.1 PTS sugar transporter subunit IIA [Clostridium sp.]